MPRKGENNTHPNVRILRVNSAERKTNPTDGPTPASKEKVPATELDRGSVAHTPSDSRPANSGEVKEAIRQGSDDDKNNCICNGGPSQSNCGRLVSEDDDAVECEKCMRWFHCKCQGISKAALTALGK